MPEQMPDPGIDVHCPHCRSPKVQGISLFGTQAISLQFRCEACRTVFEAVKYTPVSQDRMEILEWRT